MNTIQIKLFKYLNYGVISAGLVAIWCGVTSCDPWELSLANFPEVITKSEVEVGDNFTEAILGGEILGLLENTSVEEHGHIWSSSNSQPTLEDEVAFSRLNRRNNGVFQSEVKGLTPGRTIYYRAYATFDQENVYGAVLSYTPGNINITLQGDEIVSSSQEKAISTIVIRTEVTGMPDQLTIRSYGLVWAPHENPTVEADDITIDGTDILTNTSQISFESTLTNLPYEVYYARSYLALSDTVYYSPNFCFSPGDFVVEKIIPGIPNEDCNTFSFGIGGKVYFIGYSQEGCSSWCYDPETNQISEKASFPGMPRDYKKIAVTNDKVYVGFGIAGPPDDFLDDFWEYAPLADQWTQKASLSPGRYQPILFAIGEDVYAGSGQIQVQPDQTPFEPVYDFWRFEPAGNEWTRLNDSPGILPYSSTSFAIDGKGYILGVGDGFWEYLPQSDTWNEKGLPDSDLTFGSLNLLGLIDGKVYISANDFKWRYDPVTDNWTIVGPNFFDPSFSGIGRLGYFLLPTYDGIGIYYPPLECD